MEQKSLQQWKLLQGVRGVSHQAQLPLKIEGLETLLAVCASAECTVQTLSRSPVLCKVYC